LSIRDCTEVIRDVKSPWLQLYPDIGNLVANGYSLESQLQNIAKHTLSVHLKDTKINEFRRVPFGEGEVDFKLVADLLRTDGYCGNFTIEMWNDGDQHSLEIANRTLDFIKNEMDIDNE